MKRYRVVWIDRQDHDCSYETVRDAKLIIGSIYLIPEDGNVGELWGDDWDDAPEYCNAGPPYDAIRLDLSYGDILELDNLEERRIERCDS